MVVGRLVLVKGLSIPEGSRWHGMRLRLQKGDKSKWAENQSGTRFPNLGPSPTGSKTRRHVSPLSRSTFPSLQQPGRAGRFARSRPDPVDSARPVSSQAPAGVELAPDRGRLSIFLPIVVGLVVWLYRRVGFPMMPFFHRCVASCELSPASAASRCPPVMGSSGLLPLRR